MKRKNVDTTEMLTVNNDAAFPMRSYRSLRRRMHQWKCGVFCWSALVLLVCISSGGVGAQEVSSCCSVASGSCRTVCEKMSLIEIAEDTTVRDERLLNINKFCSPELVEFWKCMNETLQEVLRGSEWWGRACCGLARARGCGRACATAAGPASPAAACRRSDEQAFFECLDRQAAGEECCSNTHSLSCHEACKEVFRSRLTPSREQRSKVLDYCEETSPKVMQCVRNYTKVTPASNPLKYLHCCSESTAAGCRASCQAALLGGGSSQEMLDALERGGCGPPLPHRPPWQCLLRADSAAANGRGDRPAVDSAKLHCCHKSSTSQCKRLCLNTFTNDWAGRWERFDAECLKPPQQAALVSCIDEVEEPCELGCEGLSYCTNFNNRPTELFRSCNAHADMAAQYDVALWQSQGYLELGGLRVPLRNSTHCAPGVWRAVACALHVKPCAHQEHAGRVCHADCLGVLARCADWARVPAGNSAATLCARLSPEDADAPCIALRNFMEPSDNPYIEPYEQVSSPCKGEPCGATQVCSIDRNCPHGGSCNAYTCTNGCPLGEASQFLVPEGTYVRIPISNSQKGCLKICQCTDKGIIDKCQPLPCFSYDSCNLANKVIQHGSIFYMECNVCSCFAGEIVCSKKQCDMEEKAISSNTYLPCNCPTHHVPMCGSNGNTYPNECLAKCSGLGDADIEFGPCSSKKPCESSPCPSNSTCLPAPTVCLSLMHRPCPQYICVNASSCASNLNDPVCDSEGRTHPDPCHLVASGKQLAYMGKCLTKCAQSGIVCGINGNAYPSECAAWADFVSVDYAGPCVAVGLIAPAPPAGGQCALAPVACRAPRAACLGLTPPGACCPACGGALKLLYSRKQIDRALYALRGASLAALTLRSLLTALQRHVQVAECVVRGYVSVELDIFVMVQSGERDPSALQREACVREAEKLGGLVRRHSARIASELGLSALVAASAAHAPPAAGAARAPAPAALLLLLASAGLLRGLHRVT